MAVAENRGEGIIQLMRDTGNKLADGSQFFAVQQLFLRAAKVVVGLARFLVQLVRSTALATWLPTAINRLMSALENSRTARLPTTRPPIILSLDQSMTR